jgi:predicted nucleic acid-binding protein
MIVVDTPIWSIAFRRTASGAFLPLRDELLRLVRTKEAALLGIIRQEVLSGVSHAGQFIRLRDQLRAFPDIPIETQDFESAAECFNLCRAKGVQGSHSDFLICAIALRYDLAVFTTDRDFTHYSRHIPLRLHRPPAV